MIYKYFPFNFMWKGVCLIFSIVFLFKYLVHHNKSIIFPSSHCRPTKWDKRIPWRSRESSPSPLSSPHSSWAHSSWPQHTSRRRPLAIRCKLWTPFWTRNWCWRHYRLVSFWHCSRSSTDSRDPLTHGVIQWHLFLAHGRRDGNEKNCLNNILCWPSSHSVYIWVDSILFTNIITIL